jgi:Xaa-Pro dipeptidase
VYRNPFTDAEIARRLEALRAEFGRLDLDAGVLAAPESVFYFTGLDHWGYFAPHLLIVPVLGTPVLVTRAMEQVSVANMVRAAEFRGHSDSETAADMAARVLKDMSPSAKRIGIECWAAGMSHGLALSLKGQVDAGWTDISGLVDRMRRVKSPEEQALMRAAARVTDAATGAAIDAIGAGVPEREVAAVCLAAMTRAGGDPPAFGPFIRPAHRLGEEHTTWGDGVYEAGQPVFLELAGCVGRYHAPNGRLVHVGPASDQDLAIAEVAGEAFAAVLGALKPGARARDVYAAWQAVVDAAGLARYRRHHCGYLVGLACPPSWTGGNTVTGLRHDSDLEIETGMSFHILSWLMGSGRGDFFLSNCVLLGADGPEVLTTTPAGPTFK